MFKTVSLSLLTAALALSASAAPAGTVEPKKDQVAQDIVKAVIQYPYFTIFDDVNVQLNDGVVTLTGWVTMPYKREDIARRMVKTEGVRAVRDQIGVLPVSIFDDQLRYQTARAIYGNSNFWTYAAMANPPIHIIVRNSRVTLTGVVSNQIERMLAQTLATRFGALSVTNNLKTDAEMRAAVEKS
jgi:osmotically-inducible protein OsmY